MKFKLGPLHSLFVPMTFLLTEHPEKLLSCEADSVMQANEIYLYILDVKKIYICCVIHENKIYPFFLNIKAGAVIDENEIYFT